MDTVFETCQLYIIKIHSQSVYCQNVLIIASHLARSNVIKKCERATARIGFHGDSLCICLIVENKNKHNTYYTRIYIYINMCVLMLYTSARAHGYRSNSIKIGRGDCEPAIKHFKTNTKFFV